MVEVDVQEIHNPSIQTDGKKGNTCGTRESPTVLPFVQGQKTAEVLLPCCRLAPVPQRLQPCLKGITLRWC
eukprot:829532-Pleurochrysis_carterae.AAC.1